MAGPEEEYLIWDMRFRLGFMALTRELAVSSKNLQEVNNGLIVKIQQLEEASYQTAQQTEELAASSKCLQGVNNGLKNRIQQLEQASYQITELDEQVQDLTASSRDLKEENNNLNDRILQLEEESTRQDQKSRLVRTQLEKLEAQEEDFKDVHATMTGMNEVSKAERGLREEEIQELKAQMEALIAVTHTPREHARDASREMSQVTTEDESMLNDQHAEQPPLAAAHQDLEIQGVLIKAQTSPKLLENHLRYLEEVFGRFEAGAAQAFVSSVHEECRIPLVNKLDKHVKWTWQAALEECYKMVAAEKQTGRKSARLMARNL